MAEGALGIKLRCASWQQLATIYRRDLSKGTMFLKASAPPPIGTYVRIDLELPSATVIELTGTVAKHVNDAQRGSGVELALDPLPTKSVWLIESALAADKKVAADTPGEPKVRAATASGANAIAEGEDLAAAETELMRALESEAESLRKLNPFLVLGVGYEAGDTDVRAAFGELTKRYHPDRFARYQSTLLRQIAAEIFILIRDAYRKLADDSGRQQALASVGKAPARAPARVQTPPMGVPLSPTAPRPATGQSQPIARPQPPPQRATSLPRVAQVPPKPEVHDAPTKPGAHEAPTKPGSQGEALAKTDLARGDQPAPAAPRRDHKPTSQLPPPMTADGRSPTGAMPAAGDTADSAAIEAMIDAGRVDEALVAYKALAKKNPQDRIARAGIEVCEGLRGLASRDRLEAAQRFEAALEIDPSSERAARELADMRRQATNERKGLLSRLMGKKEPT